MMKGLALLLALLMVLPAASLAEGAAPTGCEVWLDGEPLDLINTAVNHLRVWMSRPILSQTPVGLATIEGPVEVSIAFDVPVTEAVVRPLSLGIEPQIEGDRVLFAAEGPGNYTVEVNGQVEGALHLFLAASDPDAAEMADAENVRYFGPGVHEAGKIVPEDGETIYLDEGCVLRGCIEGVGVKNVRVAGRGIIDGSTFDRWEDQVVPINFEKSEGIAIEGITILDPAAWTLNLYQSRDITVDGVKIVGARSNSDGITIQSCENVQVRDCFVRSWDDSLVVKGYDADARDITFERCVLWTDLAQSCEIGYETRADVIERITFRDITVLHNFHKPVMSIHNSDNAAVRDILFENIVVEDAQMGEGDGATQLIDLTTSKSQWSGTEERGTIRDVTFDGITVLAGKDGGIRLLSADKEHNIDDITFRNLTVLGERIESFDQMRVDFNRHTGDNVTIEAE